jgi:hypothetical protein
VLPVHASLTLQHQIMSRYFRDLQRSLNIKLNRVFFKGGEKRQLQEQLDVHKCVLLQLLLLLLLPATATRASSFGTHPRFTTRSMCKLGIVSLACNILCTLCIARLFLFTSYHAQQQQLGDAVPEDLPAQLIDQVGWHVDSTYQSFFLGQRAPSSSDINCSPPPRPCSSLLASSIPGPAAPTPQPATQHTAPAHAVAAAVAACMLFMRISKCW